MVKRSVGVDNLEKMGNLMRSRWAGVKQGLSDPMEQYAEIGGEHFALISRPDGDRVVFIVHSQLHREGAKVPFCHELLDAHFAHFAYPLMKSQLKEDLGNLRDFLGKHRQRMEMYKHLSGLGPASVTDDLTCVKAILWGEKSGLEANPANAKKALLAVTRSNEPTFALRLSPEERQLVVDKRKAVEA